MTTNTPETEEAIETEPGLESDSADPVVIEPVVIDAVVIDAVADSQSAGPVESDPVGLEPQSSGGGGGFLKRLFLAFLKVILALLIIAGLAIAAWFIILELDRSFDSVIARIDRNTRRIEEKEAEIEVLEEQNYAQGVQVIDLEAAVAAREEEIAALEEELSASLDQQGRELAELGTEAETLAGRADALDGETTILGAGLVALQEDLNTNGQQIDQLGGTVDGLSESLVALDSRSVELQGQVEELAAEELAGWRRAVALFRIWEMIGRARLHLLESNLGLAAADIDLAIAAIDGLTESDTDQTPEDLIAIRERLLLAATSLPDQPLVAGRDLETAWEALDALVEEAVIGGANGE